MIGRDDGRFGDDPTHDPRRRPSQRTPSSSLLYRGTSPVLGQPVEVQQTGELSSAFPATGGPGPTAPTAPGAPRMPGMPELPNFEWGGFNFDLAPPTPPGAPPAPGTMPGAPGAHWYDAIIPGIDLAQRGYQAAQKLGQAPAEMGGWPSWVATPEQFSLAGPAETPWWEGSGTNFSVTGGEGQPVLDPGQFGLGGAPKSGLGAGAIAPGLQAAGGLFGAVTGTPGSPSQVMSSANAAGGLAALGAQAGLLPAGAAAAGPAAALVSLPLIAGGIYERFFRGDRPQFPTAWHVGYPYPGAKAGWAAVDPATGAVVLYKGQGRYEYAPETLQGQRVSPEQFVANEIDPTGDLAKLPAYAGVSEQIRAADMARAGTPMGSAPGEPAYRPTQKHVEQTLTSQREPTIAKLRAQNPRASEGELWRLYTLTPEYAQEQAQRAGWADPY